MGVTAIRKWARVLVDPATAEFAGMPRPPWRLVAAIRRCRSLRRRNCAG
jgi:hypothetical protein